VSSIEDWERQYSDVPQRGDPDLRAARNKLDLGERNVARAHRDLDAGDPDSALIHAENAMVNAADATLARDGYRLRGKTGSRQARFEYPRLPAEFARFKAQLLMARRMRSQAMYDVFGLVSGEQANAATDAAEKLLGAVSNTFTT
jgi:HEPN domain-containing protein